MSTFRARIEYTVREAAISHRDNPFTRTIRVDFGSYGAPKVADASDVTRILEALPNVSALKLPPLSEDMFCRDLDAFDTELSELMASLITLQLLRGIRIDLTRCEDFLLSAVYFSVWKLPLSHLELELSELVLAPEPTTRDDTLQLESFWLGGASRGDFQDTLGLVRAETLRALRFGCLLRDMEIFLSHIAALQMPELRTLGLAVTESQQPHMITDATFRSLALIPGITHLELHGMDALGQNDVNLLRHLPPAMQSLIWTHPRASSLHSLARFVDDASFRKPNLRYIRIGNGGWSNFNAEEDLLELYRSEWRGLTKLVRNLKSACEKAAIHWEPKGLVTALEEAANDPSYRMLTRYGIRV